MVSIKNGLSQSQSQLFAIGAAILNEAKVKKLRATIQKENDALLNEYLRQKPKTMADLSALIMADGQADPKWKNGDDGKPIGYQKAILSGSVGAAGYNAFRSWCAKWLNEDLTKKTPESLKAEKEEKQQAAAGEKMAAEKVNLLTAITTTELVEELQKRAQAGDKAAKKFFA